LGDGGAQRFLKCCSDMGGGGGPIQDSATRREMGGSGRPAGRAVDGGERWQCRAVVQSGGRGGADWGSCTAWAAWVDCSSRPEGIVTFFIYSNDFQTNLN
jgi:hypothetical protein